MNFFDLVTSSNIVAYWINKDLNDPTVGDQLFPFKKELGVELDWIKGANNQVVGLRLSAYNSKSIRRDRQGIEKYKTEMPFFKESMVVDEKMRQHHERRERPNDAARPRDTAKHQPTFFYGMKQRI